MQSILRMHVIWDAVIELEAELAPLFSVSVLNNNNRETHFCNPLSSADVLQDSLMASLTALGSSESW